MICEMALVEIIGTKDVFETALATAQEAGSLHIEKIPLVESGTRRVLHRMHLTESQSRHLHTCEELVQSLCDMIAGVVPGGSCGLVRADSFREHYNRWSRESATAVSARGRALCAKMRSFLRRRRNIKDDLSVLAGYEEAMAALAPLVEAQTQDPDHELVGLILERASVAGRQALEGEIQKLSSGQSRFSSTALRGGRLALLIRFHQEFGPQIRACLSEAGVNEIRGPRYLRDKPFRDVLATMQSDLEALRENHRALQERVDEFLDTEGQELLAIYHVCQDRCTRIRVISDCVETRYAFIIKGWVPKRRLEQLTARLSETCGESVAVNTVLPNDRSASPVLLDNGRQIRPFERLTTLLPLPRYGTVDPTVSVATFFPPVFGLMLGDIGYAVVLGALALVLYRLGTSRTLARDLGVVLSHCALWTFGFGLVFGELFGTAGRRLGLRPLWRERLSLDDGDKATALLGYLGMAFAFGVVMVVWGLLLGFLNARRCGQTDRAAECAARIAGVAGLLLLVGQLAGFLPPAFFAIAVACLGLFLALMAYQVVHRPFHGLLMPLELLSTVGSILSFARIMAVGLASVVLALLANHLGSMIDNMVLAVIVVVLVHALNIVLGTVDPTIQGLRLHYVEFFSKFYVAGGKPYVPLKRQGGTTV